MLVRFLLSASVGLFATSALAGPDREVIGFSNWAWYGARTPYAYAKVTSAEGPVRAGKTSERFEIHAGDCGKTLDYDDCKHDREHIAWDEKGNTPLGRDVWYSFSIFVPKTTPLSKTSANLILAEFRPVGPGQINLSIEVQHGAYVAVVGSVTQHQSNDMAPPPVALWRSLGAVPKEKWSDFVVHAVWSTSKDGQLQLYQNGRRVLDFAGPNTAFNKPVHMQYGIYRSFVSRAGAPLPDQVIFFDAISKGGSRDKLVLR